MVEYGNDKELSEILKAISDGTRRTLLTQLCQQGPCRVTELAEYYTLSLNAISKHIKVLEKSGLVSRATRGRTHWISADLSRIAEVELWLKQLKSVWSLRLDKLEMLITDKEDHHE